MGSTLGAALTGAAIGLGDDIVRRAEEKRAMARELLKQKIRKDERAEDRKDKLFDTAAEIKRADTVYTRGLGDKREDAALLRGERAGARGDARAERAGVRKTDRAEELSDRAEERKLKLADRKLERDQELKDLDAKMKRNKELDSAQRERERKALKAKQDREDKALKAEQDREDKALERKRRESKEDRDVKEGGLNRRSRDRGLGARIKLSPGVGFRLGRKLTELNDGLPPSEEEVEVVKDEVKRTLKEARRNGVQMTEEEAEDEVIGRMLQGEDSAFTGSFRPRGEPVDISHIPQEAFEALQRDPSRSDEFDAKYGPGTAAAVLGE